MATKVIPVPISWEKNIIRPLDIASLTGYVSSTLKAKPTGMIGRMKMPRIAIFRSRSHTLWLGRERKIKPVIMNEPQHTILSVLKYCCVLSSMEEHTKLPTNPRRMKVAPKMEESVEVYPNGSTRLLMIAPSVVYTPYSMLKEITMKM